MNDDTQVSAPAGVRMLTTGEGLLFEHDDGRYAAAPSAEAATFAHGDPRWHRVGPVQLSVAPDKNAARYLWLRLDNRPCDKVQFVEISNGCGAFGAATEDELDTAIDAAMSATTKEN